MGTTVAAIFTTHVPRLMIFGEAERQAYMGRGVTTFYEAMEQLYRERLAELDFDTFVVFDTHWFSTVQYVMNASARAVRSLSDDDWCAWGRDMYITRSAVRNV